MQIYTHLPLIHLMHHNDFSKLQKKKNIQLYLGFIKKNCDRNKKLKRLKIRDGRSSY